tara:strand:- start:2739 stop:3659 length:921 start_codon:yes stop_codon:yes gene_type:complete
MITKKPQKNRKKFYCKKCDFSSRDKKDWKRHISTRKHLNDNKMITNDNNLVKFQCEFCDKTYKYKSGLSRHRAKCLKMVEYENTVLPQKTDDDNSSEIMKTLNSVLQADQKKMELIEKLIQQNQNLTSCVGNNNNNSISINVFLNNHCKDAMNLSEFLKKIQITNADLQYTNQYGYEKGISNIFVKHLTDMKENERPIHCSNIQNLQFYVKEGKWEKDIIHEKLDQSIQIISSKQMQAIKEWEKIHPNYLQNETELKEWHDMLKTAMGPINNLDKKNKNTTIKKELSSTVVVDQLETIENLEALTQ